MAYPQCYILLYWKTTPYTYREGGGGGADLPGSNAGPKVVPSFKTTKVAYLKQD